jgi:hypothetical protein
MGVTADAIEVAPLAGDEAIWQDFLARAANGTLFQDLRFLAYHPAGRFRFHHLVLKRNGKPIALLPGGLSGPAERKMFCSPLGASIGGFVVADDLRAERAVALVEAVQQHAHAQGWAGVEITVPPACYSAETAGMIEAALFFRNFRLAHRWLCHLLSLSPERNFEQTFRQNQISCVRTAQRNGVVAVETGLEGLDAFLLVFNDTYERHGSTATHSPEEIRYLLQNLPGRARIHLAMRGDVPIAGLLVFRLSAEVAYSFYICSSTAHAGEHGAAFVIADAMERLARDGFRILDLGPSASDMKFNKGVAFFKEGLGAFGACRDRWRWEANESQPARSATTT